MSGLCTHGSTIKIEDKYAPLIMSHYVPTCTMSPGFSTRPYRANPRLAKDSSTSTPPLQNNHGSFFILSSKENQKNTIWRKGSSHHVPTCTMSPGFDWTIQGKPKTCQRFTSQLPPPSKTTTGPLSSCLLKRNQKNTIWRKGSSHYVSTCTMSPVFSTRPNKTSPRLAKDSHLNFQPPPPKQPRVLCHLVF